ncbi:MAG: FHA domain-containing protein [Deltaproteobacteria bacterium]|nr:FHA domain-containing protein [Deltaproteobacteria bacterium]
MQPTTTDIGADKWCVTDEPFRVRRWGGTDNDTHTFPDDTGQALTVGRHPANDVILDDERVSKHHARIYFREGHWWIRDLVTKNGIIVDGIPLRRSDDGEREPSFVEEVALVPGMLLELGGVTWLVESRQLVALRSFLARLIGYGTDRLTEVDHAVRSVRRAAMGQDPLVLAGHGDLAEIARSLHRRVLGEAKPFVVCDRARSATAATVRSGENYAKALLALPAAHGGTLCVPSGRLPDDFSLILAAHREPNARFQLVLYDVGVPEVIRPNQVTPLVVPPLLERRRELNTIIQGYADDARARFRIRTPLDEADRGWIAKNASESHPEIEKATERVAAIRDSDGNVSAAATLIGMSSSALGRWFKERKPLPDLDARWRR